jgi:HAD superfamily hydrolase (TIGR01484 family)
MLMYNRPEMLEVLPLGASKGLGVSKLLEHLNIAPANLMALGDAENDIEMLK